MYLVHTTHPTREEVAPLQSVHKDWPIYHHFVSLNPHEIAHGIRNQTHCHQSTTQGDKPTYQNQWSIVVRVAGIDIDTLCYFLLAHFQVTLSTSIA